MYIDILTIILCLSKLHICTIRLYLTFYDKFTILKKVGQQSVFLKWKHLLYPKNEFLHIIFWNGLTTLQKVKSKKDKWYFSKLCDAKWKFEKP